MYTKTKKRVYLTLRVAKKLNYNYNLYQYLQYVLRTATKKLNVIQPKLNKSDSSSKELISLITDLKHLQPDCILNAYFYQEYRNIIKRADKHLDLYSF
jgi:hypothetical protein